MRTLGWMVPLLLTLGVIGCGSANSLSEGVPEDAPYVPAPKIEFRAKNASKNSNKPAPVAGTTTEAKK